MPKDKGIKKKMRHDPLATQIMADRELTVKPKENSKKKMTKSERKHLERKEKERLNSQQLPASLSNRILESARQQQQEEEIANTPLSFNAAVYSDSEDELEEEELIIDGLDEITEEDERALRLFMKPDAPQRRTLADIIMEKLNEQEQQKKMEQQQQFIPPRFPSKVIAVYKALGRILSRYKSGKLPKALQAIPSLASWEEVLLITQPEQWTPAAFYRVTKVFTAQLNKKMAQRYYNLFLLPKIRDDIAENKKLNYHLYQALKKSVFKPGPFYKGIVLPLVEAGDCTLREAVIVGSVIAKSSIPVRESAAALYRVTEMPYSGPTSHFIRVFLNKKYAMPYAVIDGIVAHFMQFMHDDREMPVLWHQSLLVFVQRYKGYITEAQRQQLRHLLKKHRHHLITDEVHREMSSVPPNRA